MSIPAEQIKRRRVSLSFPEEVAPPRLPDFEPGQHLDSDPTVLPRSDGQPQRYDDDPTLPVHREDLPPPYTGDGERPPEHRGQLVIERPVNYDAPPLKLTMDDGAQMEVGPSGEMKPPPSHAATVPYSTLERDQQEYSQLAADPNPKDTNGRFKSMLLGALSQMGRNAQAALESGRPVDEYSLAGVAGGGLGGGVAGAVRPNLDEAAKRKMRMQHLGERIKWQVEHDQHLNQLRLQTAQISKTNAEADYYRTSKPQEAEARQRRQEQTAALSNLRALNGQRLDPSNPQHAAFLAHLREAGVFVDPNAWNNSKGNMVAADLVDGDDPTQVHKVLVNKLTGEQSDLGTTRFTQPVHSDTEMTSAQEAADSDRDRGFNALERQRSVSNELQRAGLNLSHERFDFTKLERDDRLSEVSRKEIGAAAHLRSDAEQAQMDADSYGRLLELNPDTDDEEVKKWRIEAAAKQRTAANKAEAARRQYFQTYGYLHAPEGGDIHMTTDEFRQLFPNAPNPSASAPSYGVVLTDSDQPGTPRTNTASPRRPAPRAPEGIRPRGTSAAPAKPAGRVSRANFDKVRAQNPHLKDASDAEVEAALRAQGIEVY
jgi:hypothetical protein